jgi:hypothetical protein
MASKLSTVQSLNREPRYTPTRTTRLALVAALSLASAEAIAQRRPTPRAPLVPYIMVPAGSPEAAAAQAVRAGRPTPATAPTAPAPTPATNGLNFTDHQPATPVAAAAPAAPVPVAEAQPVQVPTQPIDTAPNPHPAPASETSSGYTTTPRSRRNGWFGQLGVAMVTIPNLFPRAEVANASDVTVSARNCSPERAAAGPTGRYLCSLTLSGGDGHYSVIGSNGAEVAMGSGDGRNVNVFIPGTSLSTLTVRTASGASRSFNVTTRQDGSNRTFSSQVVGETNPAEQPVLVSVMPAIQGVVGRHMGPWEVSVAARLGIGRTLSSPDLYYVGSRVSVAYHGSPRSLVAAGLQTGADFFIPEENMPTMVAIPVEATFTLRTSANPQRAHGVFGVAGGFTVPTNTNPVAGTFTFTAGAEF